MKVHIKKIYLNHPAFNHGTVGWLHSDTISGTVWVLTRGQAMVLELKEAELLIPELVHNRPDDTYEIVPLD